MEDESLIVAALTVDVDAVSRTELAEAVASDPVLIQLSEQIPQRWPRRLSDVPESLKPFYRFREELILLDGPVLRGGRIVVPASLQERSWGRGASKPLHQVGAADGGRRGRGSCNVHP